MSLISQKLKSVLLDGAKIVGNAAATAAKNTKYKMNELSNLSKRRELIAELGTKVFELCIGGVELPAEAAEIVKQIIALDGDLEALRADHAAQKAAAAEKHAAEKAARAAEKAAAKAAAAIEKNTVPVEVEPLAAEAPADAVEMTEKAETPVLDVEAAAAENAEITAKPAENEIPTLNV